MARTQIGAQLRIEGEVESDDDLLVRGQILGPVTSTRHLDLEPTGAIEGDVRVRSADVRGVLTGDLAAEDRVQIHPEGEMNGDIRAARILLADGAQFSGNVDMARAARRSDGEETE